MPAAWTEIITIGEHDLFIPGLGEIPGGNDFGAGLWDHFGIGVRHQDLSRTRRTFQLVGHEVHQNQAFLLGAIGSKFAIRYAQKLQKAKLIQNLELVQIIQ